MASNTVNSLKVHAWQPMKKPPCLQSSGMGSAETTFINDQKAMAERSKVLRINLFKLRLHFSGVISGWTSEKGNKQKQNDASESGWLYPERFPFDGFQFGLTE